MHIHMLTKVQDKKRGDCDTYAEPQGSHIFLHNYVKDCSREGKPGGHIFRVLLHIHILSKVWDHRRGDWDTQNHTVSHMFAHNYAKQMWGVWWICICVLMHVHISDPGLGPAERCLGHVNRTTQGYRCLHTLCKGVEQI